MTKQAIKQPIVDRAFAERFLTAVDRPMDYGVYFLFHDWFAEASQEAIDAYQAELDGIPGAREFIAGNFISDPLSLDQLKACAPGTLGEGYLRFVVENNLEANLGKNYRQFNEELHASGKLERLPEDMSYMMIRGFQIHDFQHVLTDIDSSPLGELKLAAFYLAQLRFPYHAMRMAVTLGHAAFVNPSITVPAMDAIVEGWYRGRQSGNLNFAIWEDHLDTPLEALREEHNIALAA